MLENSSKRCIIYHPNKLKNSFLNPQTESHAGFLTSVVFSPLLKGTSAVLVVEADLDELFFVLPRGNRRFAKLQIAPQRRRL